MILLEVNMLFVSKENRKYRCRQEYKLCNALKVKKTSIFMFGNNSHKITFKSIIDLVLGPAYIKLLAATLAITFTSNLEISIFSHSF